MAGPERTTPPPAFTLDGLRVEPSRNLLITAEGDISLEPKVMGVLCALAETPGDVLSRHVLIDRVWGVEHGADESLTRAVSILRKALGDAATIETISKRGYRLKVAANAPPSEPPAVMPARPRRPWLIAMLIALVVIMLSAALTWRMANPSTADLAKPGSGITVMVEPFTGDAAQAVFARRLGDDLAGQIASYSLYKVTSVPYTPARQDGLAYVLKGRVTGDDGAARVTVTLIDAKTGTRLWTQTYDRPTTEPELVTIIASELQSPLLVAVKSQLKARPLNTLRPWELNLLVTWVPGSEGAPPGPPEEDSFWLQKRALAIDPNYAPAHATFAEMLAYHALFDPPSDNIAAHNRARSHAERALQLAPYDAETLYHVATYYRFTGDRKQAEIYLKRVLELQPSYLTARADLYLVQGQCRADNTAQIEALRALNARMSPANPARWLVLSHLGALYLGRGDMAQAADHARQSRAIANTTWSSLTLAAAGAQLNQPDAAAIAHEHDAQWTHLDYGTFARTVVPRWCLDGPRKAQVAATFARLDAFKAQP